jgi:hypothetical protein
VPRRLRENGLSIVLFGLFAVFLLGQGLTGWRTYNAGQREHHENTVGVGMEFVTTSTFWFPSLQTWRSEFVAIGGIVVLTIFLRQRGSPESKPVAAPHYETGG